ncbi:MAG: polysaccharide biosynthesis protein [Flavobacteriales bacterium]
MIKRFIVNFTKSTTPHWVILLIDLILVMQNIFAAYIIRYNFELNFDLERLIKISPIIAVISLCSFISVGSHKGIIRHTGEKDAINVVKALLLLSISLVGFNYSIQYFTIFPDFKIPNSIIAIHFLINVIVLIASRVGYKMLYVKLTSGLKKGENILIFGAGASGLITYDVISNHKKGSAKIVGFIDDDPKKANKRIHGLNVYLSRDIDEKFVEENHVKEVIISVQNLKTKRLNQIIDAVIGFGIRVSKVPDASSWLNDNFSHGQIKQVRIEDLLQREPIRIENPTLQQEIEGQVVLVSGAAGSIGSEITRQLAKYSPKQLVLVDSAESALYEVQQELKSQGFSDFIALVSDVRDQTRMQSVFDYYKPNKVFHAAAYKHVPLMEAAPYEAVRINVLGTKNLADLSILHGVEKFVMVSTDKAVNPTNVMGATKRIAEKYVTSLRGNGTTKFITTRFGNVLGSNGSVIPLFRKQIEQGGPVTLTHEKITRYFMTIPEACQLVLEAGAMGEDGQILIFDMGESVKIYDLAIKMIQLSGFSYPDEMQIKITGLRPGEKLYEELLNSKENTLPTHHPKIMIAKVEEVNTAELNQCFSNIEVQISNLDNFAIVKEMKCIVPEFLSKNSEYEILDKHEF